MTTTPLAYRLAARLGVSLVPALALLDPKLRAGHRGRTGAAGRLAAWAGARRDRSRPLAWFHASSVGEGLQAESVLAALQVLCPDAQYVFTHFSPSAAGLARRLPVDVSDFLPYDLAGPMDRLLDALAPDLLVFAKLDLWPELAARAATRDVPVALVAATVSPGSGRLRWPARRLLRAGYSRLTAASAISSEDGRRLERLGVPRERIQALGDPRFDSVIERLAAVDPGDPLLRFGAGAPTLVAGSTWPADETVLLDAFARVRREQPDARLVLVPHEPTAEHLAGVERMAAGAGLPTPVRLSEAREPSAILLVDRVGVLAALYGAGTMAYVGGGFGRAGLHSVLEPAAWGVPVAFGPRWQQSRDAGLLLDAGAAVALPRGDARAAGGVLAGQWRGWIQDEDGRLLQGRRAREVVDAGRGAARRSAEMLAGLIGSPRPRRSPSGAR